MIRVGGGICAAPSVAAVPVDQHDPQLRPDGSGEAEQVRGSQRAAGTAADNRDDPAAAVQ
jgi:hypothetical protein